MAEAIVKERVCCKCGLSFVGNACKPCKRLYDIEYKIRNAEKLEIKNAAYRKEHAAQINARSAKWYSENSEHVRKNVAEYRRLNPEKHKAWDKSWSKRNVDKKRASSAAYRAANPEKARAQTARWVAANQGYLKEKRAEYYKANAEHKKAELKAWKVANPGRVKAAAKAWQLANHEKCRIYTQNRVSRKKANGGQLSQGLSEKLLRLQKGKCACCGAPLTKGFHMDHIIPLFKGGENTDSNIQLLTPRCNTQKHTKDPIDFMQSRGFLL